MDAPVENNQLSVGCKVTVTETGYFVTISESGNKRDQIEQAGEQFKRIVCAWRAIAKTPSSGRKTA